MATRFGVDVGGTFTDLLFYDDETGSIRVAKVPTTPSAPDEGVMNAVAAGVPPEKVAEAGFFLHGTTVGLNALLERRGAVVGLLTTDGFRDALEIRRGDKGDPYDLFWRPPTPLVPRRLRLGLQERILTDGTVLTPLDESRIPSALETFAEENVTAIAVSFINAYANPAHELRVRDLLREHGFEGEISLSHEVSGEYREYERTSTVVVDGFVRARMSNYLQRLGDQLASHGFSGQKLVTRSGGGSLTFSQAQARPFETIMSGPVAGAEGAGELARKLGLGDVVTADVGGTSFDTALITEGRPKVMFEGNIVGFPLQTSWVDVRSIGAGGGSIAYVDRGGLLRVGPRSAGAVPGPACYGKGGVEPATTDAAFILGMLGPGKLASGLELDRDAAVRAMEPLAAALGFEVEEVARGIMTIVAANMANAIREVSIEQGSDPREATLMPFGGAGPLFGTLLADELDMRSVLVPGYAGNFSAWGLLGSDLTQTTSRTHIAGLDDAELSAASETARSLFVELAQRAEHEFDASAGELSLDLRYVGQEYTLAVSVGWDGSRVTEDAATIRGTFDDQYVKAFGHALEDDTEIVAVRATIRRPLPDRKAADSVGTSSLPGVGETTRAWSFTREKWMDFPVVARADVPPAGLSGPAIVLEETATTYLDAGFRVEPGDEAVMWMKREESQ